jgi:thioredoxin-related protein
MRHSEKIKTYLEIATNIAVLLAAVTVLSLFAWNYYQGRQIAAQLQPGLQKGMTLDSLPGLSYSNSPRTLLIAMNTQCSYCAASVSFYNQLAAVQKANSNTHVVALFPDSAAAVRTYVEQKQLSLETMGEIDLSKIRVAGTPTMILIDSTGKILDFWVGQLSADAEHRVIQSLST